MLELSVNGLNSVHYRHGAIEYFRGQESERLDLKLAALVPRKLARERSTLRRVHACCFRCNALSGHNRRNARDLYCRGFQWLSSPSLRVQEE